VLPFKVQTNDPELKDFARGLAEDISNGLSDFSYLLVLSRNAISGLTADSVDVRQIGNKLGARYVLQGALRKSGSTTRITAQLVDALNGTQIWTETFDRELTSAMRLNPQHAGWYYFNTFFNEYRQNHYVEGLHKAGINLLVPATKK